MADLRNVSRSCTIDSGQRQTFFNVDTLATIDYDTVVVVPDISLFGDQSRYRTVYDVSCGMDEDELVRL